MEKLRTIERNINRRQSNYENNDNIINKRVSHTLIGRGLFPILKENESLKLL
jgi:hypothetical protein